MYQVLVSTNILMADMYKLDMLSFIFEDYDEMLKQVSFYLKNGYQVLIIDSSNDEE